MAPLIGTDMSDFECEQSYRRIMITSQITNMSPEKMIERLLVHQKRVKILQLLIKLLLIIGCLILLCFQFESSERLPVIFAFTFFNGSHFQLNDRIKAQKKDNKVIITYLKPTRIELDMNDQQSLDAEIIRMCRLKQEYSEKYITQKEIGRLFGVSRQMINRRNRVVTDHDLLTLLQGQYVTEILRDDVKNRIAELLVSNWRYTNEQIADILIKEALVQQISTGTIQNAIKQVDGIKVRKLMRQMLTKGRAGQNEFSQDYLIDSLFDLVDKLMSQQKDNVHPYQHDYDKLTNFKKAYLSVNEKSENEQKTKYKKDRAYQRVHLARDRNRVKNAVLGMVYGYDSPNLTNVICPDCHSNDVIRKHKRKRSYTDEYGVKHTSHCALVAQCKNPDCSTNYFTVLPDFIQQWARYTKDAKRKGFKLIFHVRSSFRRAASYLNDEHDLHVSWSCLLNWIRKAGAECPLFESIFPLCKVTKIIIDEKYIKLFKEWIYLYVAVDESTGEAIHMKVLRNLGQDSAKLFLLELKLMGYNPETIVTDLCPDYPGAITKIFPKVHHHQCVLHAERAAKRLLNKYLPKSKNEHEYQKLKKAIRHIFKQKEKKDLKKAYQQFIQSAKDYSDEVKPVFDMIERYYFHLKKCIENKNIPKTSNVAENLIKEFDLKYRTTMGYSSIEAIREFVKAYNIYLRLCPRASGKGKTLSPAQQSRTKNIPITWDEYLLAA